MAEPQAPSVPATPPPAAPTPPPPAPYVPTQMPGTPAAPPAAPAVTPPAPAAPAQPATPPATPAAPESILAPKPAEPAKPSEPARGPDGKFLPKEAPPAEPLEIELKLPEGFKPDERLLGEFKGIMADPKKSAQEKAQALVEWNAKSSVAQAKAIDEKMQRDRVADLELLKGDPEFGGAHFDKTVADARSILAKTKYGPAVSKKLQMYGLDCDPDFVKYNAEIRSLIAEDTTSSRVSNAAPEVEKRPMTQTERVAATYKSNPIVK